MAQINFTVPSNLDIVGNLTVTSIASAMLRVDSAGKISTTTLQSNLSLSGSTLSLAAALTSINSITSAAGQNLVLALGTGGTALTLTNSTLAAIFAGDLSVGTAGANATVTIGATPSANNTGRLKFITSNSVVNWQVSSNDLTAGAFEITPSSAAGGSTFSAAHFALNSSAGTLALTKSGGRSIVHNYSSGFTSYQANTGGWNMGLKFLGSSGTIGGAIWGAGTNDTISTITIGSGDMATAAITANLSTLATTFAGTVIQPSTATAGYQIYNTVDQTTNYERLEMLWSSNIAVIQTAGGGGGSARELRIKSTAGITLQPNGVAADKVLAFQSANAYTNTSGSVVFCSITPAYNQASGTAANTDLLINRTQTAVGSGTQLLIDAQVGGVSYFKVSNAGLLTTQTVSVEGSSTSAFEVKRASGNTVGMTLNQTGVVSWNFYNIATTGVLRVETGSGGGFTVSTAGALTTDSHLQVASAALFAWSSRSAIGSSADGVIHLRDNAGTSFNRLQFGGTTSSFPAIKRSTVELQARLADDSAFANFYAANFTAGTSNLLQWTGRTIMQAPADGILLLSNAAQTDFARINLGGSSSSFPALKRSSAELHVRLADDSAYANFAAADIAVGGSTITFVAGGRIATTGANTLFLRTNGTDGLSIDSSQNLVSPGTMSILSGLAIPAAGSTGAGFKFSSTSNFGIFFGSGAPTLSAAKGSLYLRSDGSSSSTRLYVNTDGSTSWTNVTTAT